MALLRALLLGRQVLQQRPLPHFSLGKEPKKLVVQLQQPQQQKLVLQATAVTATGQLKLVVVVAARGKKAKKAAKKEKTSSAVLACRLLGPPAWSTRCRGRYPSAGG